MRLVVAAVGRLKRGAERDLAEEYRDRAAKSGRAIGMRSVEIVEVDESRARRARDRMTEEAAALAAGLPDNSVIIVLDERGESLPQVRRRRSSNQRSPLSLLASTGCRGLYRA